MSKQAHGKPAARVALLAGVAAPVGILADPRAVRMLMDDSRPVDQVQTRNGDSTMTTMTTDRPATHAGSASSPWPAVPGLPAIAARAGIVGDEALAERLGMTGKLLTRIKAGKYKADAEDLSRWARALECEARHLTGELPAESWKRPLRPGDALEPGAVRSDGAEVIAPRIAELRKVLNLEDDAAFARRMTAGGVPEKHWKPIVDGGWCGVTWFHPLALALGVEVRVLRGADPIPPSLGAPTAWRDDADQAGVKDAIERAKLVKLNRAVSATKIVEESASRCGLHTDTLRRHIAELEGPRAGLTRRLIEARGAVTRAEADLGIARCKLADADVAVKEAMTAATVAMDDLPGLEADATAADRVAVELSASIADPVERASAVAGKMEEARQIRGRIGPVRIAIAERDALAVTADLKDFTFRVAAFEVIVWEKRLARWEESSEAEKLKSLEADRDLAEQLAGMNEQEAGGADRAVNELEKKYSDLATRCTALSQEARKLRAGTRLRDGRVMGWERLAEIDAELPQLMSAKGLAARALQDAKQRQSRAA